MHSTCTHTSHATHILSAGCIGVFSWACVCVCVCLCVFVRFCVAVCWLLQCMVLLDGAFLLCLCVLCVCLCLFAWQCSVSCSMDKLDFIAMGTSNSHVEKTWEESACHAPLPPFGSLSFDLARLFVRRVQG